MKNDLVNSQNIPLNTRNLSQINFKQKIPKTVNEVITDKTLAIASSAATAMGLATITISKNNNEVKKFDHDKLAIEIQKRIDLKHNPKQICEELGISVSLYCNIIRDYKIQTPRQKSRENRKNVNIEEFKKDVLAHVPKTEILAKYNISSRQYLDLINECQIQSKKMENNEKVRNITKEEFLNAIRTCHNPTEVCRQFGITHKTYFSLKEEFGILEDTNNGHEEWDCLTTHEIEELANSKRKLEDICEEYNVTPQRVQNTYRVEGIKTANVVAREIRENLDLEILQNDIDLGMNKDEILSKHKISRYQFQTLIDNGLIITLQKRARDKINSITQEQFQSVVNVAMNTNDAMEKLGGISKGAFYSLAKKFEIEIPWMNKRSNSFPVKKEVLEADINSGLTIEQICAKYSISQYMYYQMINTYKIKSSYKNLKQATANITTEELQKLIETTKYHKDIYKELGLTRKQYSTLLRRRGIKTKHQEVLTKISKISREELVSLVLDGAKLIDICSKYQINPTTCYYLLKQNSVDWSVNGYSTNNLELENMNIDELKDNLVNLLINNDSIASNNKLSDLIDFVFNAPIDSNCTKEDLVKFIKILKNIENKNINSEDALERQEIQFFDDIYDDQISLINRYNDKMDVLSKHNEKLMLEICLKYIPDLSSNNEKSKIILDLIENIEDVETLKQTLAYYDAKFSNNEYLTNAESYALVDDKIDVLMAGKYLLSLNEYESGSKNDIINAFIQDIKNNNTPQDIAVKNILKLNEVLENNDLETMCLTDFIKTFNLNDENSIPIIKHFVENYYIKNNTTVTAVDDKARKERVTLTSAPKQEIYNKYKGIKGIEVLSLFDEALHHIVASEGQAGIKFFTRGKIKYPRLKIMGYPDRINSSKFNLVFDEYSSNGGHK